MKVDTLRWRDNFIYCLSGRGKAAVVDPSDASMVCRWLGDCGLTLEALLVTHGHADHTGGCAELERRFGCAVYTGVRPEPLFLACAAGPCRVLHTPGHTEDSVCYWFESEGTVFTGDTLFAGGCGRPAPTGMERLWRSLETLKTLPGNTIVHCGHDYTVDNLEFAAEVAEPGNRALRRRLDEARRAEESGRPIPPSTIRLECETNPFLRAEIPEVAESAGVRPGDPFRAFAALREMKNRW